MCAKHQWLVIFDSINKKDTICIYMKHLNLSLKYKLTLFVSFVIFLLFILTNYIIINHEQDILYENLISKGNSLIDNFALYSENAFYTGDELDIVDYVIVLMKNKEVRNIYIVLENLTFFLHNNQKFLGKKYIPPKKVEVNLKQNYTVIKTDKKRLYQFYKPIYHLNEKGKKVFLGMGYIEVSPFMIHKRINQIKLKLTLIFIILLVIGVVCSFILSYFMTNPIKKLIKGINRIAKGDLKYKIRLQTRDEIENLAVEFNRMTTQLSSYQKKIIKQRIVEQELQIAQNIQSQIIPDQIENVKGYKLFNFHKTSRAIGGDYHNLVKINNHEYLFIIGDVSGKGVPASLIMVMFHSVIVTLKNVYNNPVRLMKAINTIMSELLKKGNFITVMIGLLNIRKNTIKVVSAGHEPLILINYKKKQFHYLKTPSLPIGLMPIKDFESKLQSKEYKLAKDNLLIFFTDGLRNIEKKPMNNDQLRSFFTDMIKKSQTIDQCINKLLDRVEIKKYDDDITIVGVMRS